MSNKPKFRPGDVYRQPDHSISQITMVLFFGLFLGFIGGFVALAYGALGVASWNIWAPTEVDAFTLDIAPPAGDKTYADVIAFLKEEQTSEAEY